MLKNKYIIGLSYISTLISIGLLSTGKVFAQTQPYTIVPLVTLPGLTTVGTAVNPTTYIQGLYAFAIGIGVVIAVVSGVYAGIEYMLSETSIGNVEKAKQRIQNVGWGAALLFCSYLLLSIINPQLINWNLNLGNINTSQQAANLQAQTAQQASDASAAQATLAQEYALSATNQTATDAIQTDNNIVQDRESADTSDGVDPATDSVLQGEQTQKNTDLANAAQGLGNQDFVQALYAIQESYVPNSGYNNQQQVDGAVETENTNLETAISQATDPTVKATLSAELTASQTGYNNQTLVNNATNAADTTDITNALNTIRANTTQAVVQLNAAGQTAAAQTLTKLEQSQAAKLQALQNTMSTPSSHVIYGE